MERVFVYGTLKRGEPNEHVMQNTDSGRSLFVGHAQMLMPHPLIVSTKFNIPFLLKDPGRGEVIFKQVFGE
jgi:gamma-glutamylaminecyclotransferase